MDKYKEIIQFLREFVKNQDETEFWYGVDLDDINVIWQAANAIEELLNISKKPTDWIPVSVSERLPEEDFLATTAWGDVTYASVSGGDIYIHEGNTNAEWSDIIAWQPLPEPYKREE